jgi:small subunit ribosomal protein S16
LDDAGQEQMSRMAARLLGKPGSIINPTFREDPKLIGGFRIETDDTCYDSSVARGLKELNKSTVNGERVKYWISVGAQPTYTMHNLLITNKVISGKKVNVLPRKSPIKKEEVVVADTPKVETKEEATPKAEVAEVVEEAKAEESPKAE